MFKKLLALLAPVSFSLLTGCALQTTAPFADTSIVPGTAISGTVHGGNQALNGAKVYLLAVNPSGYGGPGIAASSSNASLSLLNPAKTGNATDTIGSFVLTDNVKGAFTLNGDYSCSTGYLQGTTTTVNAYSASQTAGTEQVYLYVLGGTAQYTGAGQANPSSGLLVALGPCNSPTTRVAINEITTVATAYAFAGFASDATHIGSSGSALALTNLANAFTNVGNLANTTTGLPTSTTSSGNGTTPTASVYTIANILAACVNTNTSNSNCTTLFQYTNSNGATGTAPTDTATAAINLAHNPWPTAAGMTALYGLIPGIAPFAGSVATQPNDFNLPIIFSPAMANYAYDIAADASGNIWIASTNYGNKSVGEIAPSGAYPLTASGTNFGGILSAPQNISIDRSGNIWVTDGLNGNIYTYVPSTATASTFNPSACGKATNLVFTGSSSAWLYTFSPNHLICRYTVSGTTLTLQNSIAYSSAGTGAVRQAVDIAGNDWISDITLFQVNSSATLLSPGSGYSIDPGQSDYAVGIDPSGFPWVAGSGNNLTKVSTTGTSLSSYTGGGLNGPIDLAIDSARRIFLSNYNSSNGNSISSFSSAGTALSPTTGYTSGSLSAPFAILVDGSGNLWVSSFTNASIVEYVGASSPVVTPVAANLVAPYNAPASRP